MWKHCLLDEPNVASVLSKPKGVVRVLSSKFLLGGEALNMCMGGAHSEREDFAKSARRDVIDSFHMKMHF